MQRPNPSIATVIRPFDDDAINDAAARIRAGECVAIPTETVYGLAADATNGEAVASVYAAKGRPSFNPLIVHVADIETAKTLAEFGDTAEMLAKHFWPGPLTMVLPQSKDNPIADIVTAGLDTIAIRIPAHPAMRALLRASERPIAAPSANSSGRISPTQAEHVQRSLDSKIGLIIDAGASGLGLESTIIEPATDAVRLLRPGPITADQITDATGVPIEARTGQAITAPGQLATHYAPTKPLRLDAEFSESDEWLIGFGAVQGDASLSERGDLIEAAANLFSCLHQAEASDRPKIAIAPLPHDGIGAAIADRLARAAHRD